MCHALAVRERHEAVRLSVGFDPDDYRAQAFRETDDLLQGMRQTRRAMRIGMGISEPA